MEIVWKDCANTKGAECPAPVAARRFFISFRSFSLTATRRLPLRAIPAFAPGKDFDVTWNGCPWFLAVVSIEA
jgi:hypothetical protein